MIECYLLNYIANIFYKSLNFLKIKLANQKNIALDI